MGKAKDITGMKFGRLTAIKFSHIDSNKIYYWLCQCECGNVCVVNKAKLISGHTQSCGCLQRERTSDAKKKHGLTDTRLYRTWKNMKNRCCDSKNKKYKDYGGRGITVCDEWKNDFQAFYDWSILNGHKDNLTIDRINVNGNYEPSNCRWVDWNTQRRNKRNNHNITYKGETHCITEWAEILGIKPHTLLRRIHVGWDIEKAFSTPTLRSLK